MQQARERKHDEPRDGGTKPCRCAEHIQGTSCWVAREAAEEGCEHLVPAVRPEITRRGRKVGRGEETWGRNEVGDQVAASSHLMLGGEPPRVTKKKEKSEGKEDSKNFVVTKHLNVKDESKEKRVQEGVCGEGCVRSVQESQEVGL